MVTMDEKNKIGKSDTWFVYPDIYLLLCLYDSINTLNKNVLICIPHNNNALCKP